ncbi:amino acid/polyamine/organocation transporter, APC superfamily [Austwickia chelonae]|uniref:Putative amino acid transporter n=1 Tax=Austwickia chelonae NBRC 105200 TaxID=1184607 RepID=K6UNA1_9MICO|nr:APC family permease [Austwickia chelonae]GAB78806.1 putative amino acid transporter [Austwickia chelonae NBRC 105200]SEV84573.1 amino acid/polyamine/organocation transporter, APC superfamily [Austwickia chelonae]
MAQTLRPQRGGRSDMTAGGGRHRQITPTLRRRLTFPQLIGYGLAFIGPSAAIGAFGVLDSKSGGMAPVAYLIATIAMSFTAASYVMMSRQVPRAGSVFAYANAGIGPRSGFLAGWMIMLDYLLIPAVAYLFSGFALNSIIPSIPIWAWIVVVVAVTTSLNLIGVRVAAQAALVMVVISTVVLAFVLFGSLLVLITSGPQRPWTSPLTGVGSAPATAVIGAVSVAALSFLGFDALTTFVEESIGGRKAVARATVTCLILAGILFFVQTYVGSLLSPPAAASATTAPDRHGVAFYEMVGTQIAPWLKTLLALTTGASAAFSAMVGQAAASRILLDMGREQALPKFFTMVSPRAGVPVSATASVAVINLGIAFWASMQANGLEALVSIVAVGALAAFVLVHLSVIGYFWTKRKDEKACPLRHGAVPGIGALILLVVLAHTSSLALMVGAGWLVVGGALALVRGPRQEDAGMPPNTDAFLPLEEETGSQQLIAGDFPTTEPDYAATATGYASTENTPGYAEQTPAGYPTRRRPTDSSDLGRYRPPAG